MWEVDVRKRLSRVLVLVIYYEWDGVDEYY